MATENLKVKITADASQAKAEIGKFKAVLKKTTDGAEDSSGKMNALKIALDSVKATAKENIAAQSGLASSLGKVAVAAGALAVTLKTIKSLVNNAIDVAATGDAIKDNAQKVFMGTTAYQEWGYVLEQNGIEMSALKVGMRQFAQQVANGSDALAKYGITATDVDTAFQQAVYTIQNMSTETEKIAAATELFGTRALELFPVLNLTNSETQNLMATYRALGGTMSNELIAASDECTDSITAMKAAWGGLRNVLAAYVIPVITKVVKWITLAIAYVRILLGAILGVKASFGGPGSTGGKKGSLPASTGAVASNTGNTAKNLKKAVKHAKELKRTLMGIDELTRLVEQATANAASGGGGGGGNVGGGGIGDIGAGVGDVGSFDGIISDDTLAKIQAFQEKIDGIKDKLHGAYLILKGITEIAMGNPVQGFKDLKEGIELMFPSIQTLKEKWADLKANIKDIVANIRAQIATKWADLKGKWDAIIGNIKDKVAAMKAKVTTKWSDIKTRWHNVIDNIKNKTADMKAKVATKWSNLKSRWKTLMGHFKDKTVSIGLKFSAAAQNLKNWINSNVFSKINNVFAKVPILNRFSLRLAKGGVLTAPTQALVGEYPGARSNPEIVTPQSLMFETMMRANTEMVSAQAEIGRQIISAIERQNLEVKIGDETIARSAQRGNTAYKNRTGKPLLTV